jgi:dTDP-4-amino-4,6-dideoxygalactose transaminase
MRYIENSCPISEELSTRIVNLPTGKNISKTDAIDISNFILSNINE